MSVPVQFPCQHCGNLMAVVPELVGQHVRCPHCQQVVQAPFADVLVAEAPTVTPMPVVTAPLPEIAFRVEETESIFSEGSDEELFAGPPLKPEMPTEPAPAPPSSSPSWLVDANPLAASAGASPSPWGAFTEPVPLAPDPPPDRAVPHLLDLQAMDVPYAPRPISTEVPIPAPGPAPPRRISAEPAGRNFTNLALTILVPYALAMTFLTVWLAIRQSGAKQPSPLELLPDYGEQQGKTSKGHPLSLKDLKLPSVDTALPPGLKVKLGESIAVGQLQVTPERVVQAPAQLVLPGADGNRDDAPRQGRRDNLILHLRLKNVSPDVYFCPTDPLFDRRWDRNEAGSRPFALLEVGAQKFYGGVLDWPPKQGFAGAYLRGQEHDSEPLAPGQERETVAVVRSDYAAEALRYKQGPLVWRVHLRTGLTEYHGREVQSSAVVGIEFSAGDIKKSG